MDWAALFACITALGTGWFAYNQLKHNRLADIKAKELERQLERKSTRRSENSARVYGEIHKVLNDLSCDRVYIIQPYPLGDNHYLTILYEVTAKGVARISDFWQDIKMSELPKFTASMARNELMLIRDIDSLDGTRAKAMFSSNGTQSLIVQKLHDTTHDWVGSLVCDFTESIPNDFDEEAIRKKLHFAAMHIQYILPEVRAQVMRVTEYLKELIKNGSGHSSKSFFLVAVTLIGCFLLLIVGFILVYEVIVNKSIKTDLMGLSAFVGAITALFASAGVTKCLSEKNENKNV